MYTWTVSKVTLYVYMYVGMALIGARMEDLNLCSYVSLHQCNLYMYGQFLH